MLPQTDRITNLTEYLPGLLTIDQEPMSLADRFPFSPVFSTKQPPVVVHRSSRQIGKTRSIAGRLVLDCAMTPGEKVLIVTPLQEQSDVLSATIFKPMIEDSPIRVLLRPDGGVGSVRRRDFANRAMLQFSFAFLDTERVRSKTGRILYLDEAQDLNPGHVPVIEQCQASHRAPQTWVSGTSKTKDTFLEAKWQMSSQGVWHIPCSACGYDNRCCLEPDGDLLATIGPAHDGISERSPGTVCRGCLVPISPRLGRWVHRYPERLRDVAGYYAPQTIFPFHYAEPGKWRDLTARMNGVGGYTQAKFYNECLGEAFDQAFKLLSINDLQTAGQGVGPNTEAAAAARGWRYVTVVLGVDWGGGGATGVSRTKVAAAGLTQSGRVEVFYGAQFAPGTDRVAEGREVLRIARLVNARMIAHDAIGVGVASEAVLTHLGWPVTHIAPMVYRGMTGGELVEFHQPAQQRMRGFFTVDKAKTLQFLAMAVRAGAVRFFDYDHVDSTNPGLLHDFLALVEDLVDTPNGGAYRIVRKKGSLDSDDFAHATNYAACALWEQTGSWPDLTTAGRLGGLG